MVETRTDVVIGAKTQGMAQVERQVSKLSETATKAITDQTKGLESQKRAYSEAQREIKTLERSLQDLGRQQVVLRRAMQGTERGTTAYKELATQLKSVKTEATEAQASIQTLERAFDQATRRRGAFTQGLLQGALPSTPFLQRGPGVFQQAAGTAVGQFARRGIGGMLSTPFTGMQGLSTALGGIPVAGAAMASVVNQMMATGARGLNLRQIQAQVAPYLGGTGFASSRGTRGMQVEFDAMQQAATAGRASVTNAEVEARARQLAANETQAGGDFSSPQARIQAEILRYDRNYNRLRDEARQMLEAERTKPENIYEAGRKARVAYENQERAAGFAAFETTGQRFGFDRLQSLQAMAAVSQAGGGTGEELRRGGGATFLAAQRLGISPGVSGAFVRGERQGAIAGGGLAERRLEQTFKSAVRLGLEGSELDEYMGQVAAGINSWKTTGIPLNARSMTGISRGLAVGGLGGVRGGVVSQSIMGGAQQLADRGVQSALDMQALQTLGGFQGGGGAEGYVAALRQLEEGRFDSTSVQKFIRQLSERGGGGALGQLTIQSGLKELGARVSLSEAALLQKTTEPNADFSQEEKRQLSRVRGRIAQGRRQAGAGLQERAAAISAPELLRQAEIADRQTKAGETMVESTQNMEDAMTRTMGSLTQQFGPAIGEVTGLVDQLAGSFQRLLGHLDTLTASIP